jgi:crossover junction endodeoxyribonuclease RusA
VTLHRVWCHLDCNVFIVAITTPCEPGLAGSDRWETPMPPSPLKEITFTVDGLPVSKGSMIPGRSKMRAYRAKDLKAWQSSVAFAAKQAGWGNICLGPVAVKVTFYLKRPACHYNTKGLAKGFGAPLRNDAPQLPYRKPHPDLDKVERALGDALQGVCYIDDVQICAWDVDKVFADDRPPGVKVRVATIGG